MTLKSLTILAVLTAGFGIISEPVMAKSKINSVPANFPPASYKGKQFVDNRGCVYVRAGFDDAVNWVPRVSRQRAQVCGQKPTFGGTTAAAQPAAKPAPKPVQITAPAPKPAPTVTAQPAPKPAPRVAAKPAPKPRATQQTVRAAPKPPAPKPQVRTVRAPASKPVAAQPPRVVRSVPKAAAAPVVKPQTQGRRVTVPSYNVCRDGLSTKVVEGRTYAVRCGPQKSPHVTVIRRGEAAGPGSKPYSGQSRQGSELQLPGRTRIVPRHVYEQRDTQVAVIPEGYRPAWEDDRLNLNRAYQTVRGYNDTQIEWTNTVPRRLVVQSNNHKVKPVPIAYYAARPYGVVASQGTTYSANTPRISTKSAPVEAIGGARFVEIGVFTTNAKAQAAANRLNRAGLPVQTSRYTHKGHAMRRVMVGPYASHAALNAGLRSVRSVGYAQAYTR